MSEIKRRVARLEKIKKPGDGHDIFVVDWGDPLLDVPGVGKMTREEFDRLYPEGTRVVIEYVTAPYPDDTEHDQEASGIDPDSRLIAG